jgi:hypothetical protein
MWCDVRESFSCDFVCACEGDSEERIATTCLAGRRVGHVNSCGNYTRSYQAEVVCCGNSTTTLLVKVVHGASGICSYQILA